MTSSRLKHRKRDLIFLVFPANICYTVLQTKVPESVEVDTKEGTWTFGGQTFLIGCRRPPFYAREGLPIGAYNRTRIEHLRAMKRDTEEITRRPMVSD